MFKFIKKCRVCNDKNLKKIIDLGNQPPANSLTKSRVNQKLIPLSMVPFRTLWIKMIRNTKIKIETISAR